MKSVSRNSQGKFNWLPIVVGFLMPIGTVATFLASDAKAFQAPELARMVFWHLPCALVSSALLFLGPYFGFRFLRTNDRKWDVRAEAVMELGFLFGILTLITGMLFSQVQWGTWWNWDPRQSSYLMVMFIVTAYFGLRTAFQDPAHKAGHSAAYNLAALIPVFFLIFVYPRLPQVKSLHPNVIQEGTFDTEYRAVFYSMLALIGLATVWIYRLRVSAGLAELKRELSDAELATRDHSAAPSVVRPVSLSPSDPGSRA